MAEASTEILVPLNSISSNKSEEYVTSYSGEICYLASLYGILKFSLHGSKCYVFFIFKNVFAARDSTGPVHPNQILIKQAYNFHILPLPLPNVNNIRCFHAGLVWKQSKPRNVLHISFDLDKAKSVLKSYLWNLDGATVPVTAAAKIPVAPPPVRTVQPTQITQNLSGQTFVLKEMGTTFSVKPPAKIPVAPPPARIVQPTQVKQHLSGQTGIVWKVINNDEGLMLIRKDKGGKIIWFNRSNLEKIQMKFNNLKQLVGVALHFDAELLHAPANRDDYVWYQGTAFWDSGMLKPSIPNGFVGVKILDYKPTSDFSKKLKQGVELKTTNQFPPDRIDNIFNELTKARMFKEFSSLPKKETKAKEVAQLWDNVKKLNEDLKSLKLENEKMENERRTSLPGFAARDENSSTKSFNSLPNAVKNEILPSQTGTTYLNYNWRGNDVYYFNFPELKPVGVPEIKPARTPQINKAGSDELFEIPNGHLLNLQRTDKVPNYFFASLNFKTVFNRGYTLGDLRVTSLPSEITEEEFIERTATGEDKKRKYLSSVPNDANVLLEKGTKPAFLLKEPGSISHLSESFRTGLIHCKYGSVYFKYEDFYDCDQDPIVEEWNVGEEICSRVWVLRLRPVFFDGYLEDSSKYVATCVWTQKRPDIQKLIESVADSPKKIKPGKHVGTVVKLDLPSNAIVKLTDDNVGVVVTRGIFDPERTGNICDYLSIGESLQISIEDHTVNYYAENAIRHLRHPSHLTDVIEGYAVITNYSNRLGIFEYPLPNHLLTGIFIKDLARNRETSRYLPIGSYIRITGFLTDSHKLVKIIATSVEKSLFLKGNPPSRNFPDDKPEFVPKKTYLGVVKSIRKPYACVLEAVSENNEKVKVFVSSKRFAPGRWKPCLTYADQIQFHVNVEDKVMFTAEVCSDVLGLHPFKWNAVKARKIESEDSRLKNTSVPMDPSVQEIHQSDGAVKRELSSAVCSDPRLFSFVVPPAAINVQPIRKEGPKSAFACTQTLNNVLKKEDSRSYFLFPAPVNNSQSDESFEEAMLKTALKNSLRDEAVMPESLMNKIVDNFSRRLTKEMLVGSKKNKTDTKDKATQTLSSGKVIYLKIYPS